MKSNGGGGGVNWNKNINDGKFAKVNFRHCVKNGPREKECTDKAEKVGGNYQT